MRIVQVCPRYYPDIGGVETHVKEISERLVKRGFEVEVVCTDPAGDRPQEEIINGVNVRRFRCFAPNEAYFIAPQIYFYLKRNHYDIVHLHSYHAFPALFASLASKQQKKIVFSPYFHGRGHTFLRQILHKLYFYFAKQIFYRAKKIMCLSNYERNLVLGKFNIKPDKIVVIPSGIDVDKIKDANPFNFDGKLVLYVGRLEKYKNVHLLLKAMKELPDYQLHLIGQGGYKHELEKLTEKLHIEDRTTMLNNVANEDLYRWLRTCDVFVTLSEYESFGITVLEALAAKKPVVVNTKSSLKEFTDNFESSVFGIDTSNMSIVSLAKLIRVKSNMSVNTNLDEYRWDHIASRVAGVYYGL